MAKLRHCGILVYNLDLSTKLYCDVFGFTVLKKGVVSGDFSEQLFNLKNFHLTYVKLKSKGCNTKLELWKIKDFAPNWSNSYSHIALTVKDLDKTYEALRERKLTLFSLPMQAHDSEVRLFFARDYDQNILEIVEDKPMKP